MFVDDAALFYTMYFCSTSSTSIMSASDTVATYSITHMIKCPIDVEMTSLTVYACASHILFIYHYSSSVNGQSTHCILVNTNVLRKHNLKNISTLKKIVKNE